MASKVFIHSIKNNLFAIKTIIDMQDQLNETRPHGDFQRILKICDSTIENLNALYQKTMVRDLIYEKASLNQVIDESIDQLSTMIPKNIKVNVMINEGELHALVDKKLIYEVIKNIITNCIENFNENNGAIDVKLMRKERWIVISISDTGTGIPEEMQKNIFTPYFSGKPSTKNWGLGLAYSKQIILAHGGDITFKSVYGEGTTMYIYIPYNL
jgi:signal transduction histidine kinase